MSKKVRIAGADGNS